MSITQITADNFQAEVLQAGVPVLVDFYGDHCGPCRAMVPVLAELADETVGRAKVFKVDVATEEKLAREYGIDLIPTLIVFNNGEPIARTVGIKTKRQLIEALGLA